MVEELLHSIDRLTEVCVQLVLQFALLCAAFRGSGEHLR
jgi:hypothetical protein